MTLTDVAPTGVPGLDELIGGGLPRGSCTLLMGGPGTGKTTLSLQFLHAGATRFNEPGLYVTLNETAADIYRNAANFGWDFAALEKGRAFALLDARPFKVSDKGFIVPNQELFVGREDIPFSRISYLVYNMTRELGVKRVVVDSVNVLLSQFKDEFVARQGLIGLVQALNHFGCTSLLILEKAREEVAPEEFIAQGIIELQLLRVEQTWTRAVRVGKMRGVKHDLDAHPIVIEENGVKIFVKEKVLI
ncbi:MAG: ATPase domain-containing protein [Candidatus Bathyarchaeia archaeon]